MTQANKELEKVKDFLRSIINPLNFNEVEQKKDLMESRYFICPIGEDSHKISVMYTSTDDALRCAGAFQRARLQFQRPADKPYLVKILMKSVLAAAAIKESQQIVAPRQPEPPVVPVVEAIETLQLPEEPAPQESPAAEPEANPEPKPQQDLEEMLRTIKSDKEFGYTNMCTRYKGDVKYRLLFFNTESQAKAVYNLISKSDERITTSSRGVHVPSIVQPENVGVPAPKMPKATSKKRADVAKIPKPIVVATEEPLVLPVLPRTPDDIFTEYKNALRAEIEQEHLAELDNLKQQLLALDHKLDDLLLDNYIIPKKGTGSITLAPDEIVKGTITVDREGFTISKELLAPFCIQTTK